MRERPARHRRAPVVTLVATVAAMIATGTAVAASVSWRDSPPGLAEFVQQTVDTLPGRGSGAFVDGDAPTVALAARAIQLARTGSLDEARPLLNALDYDIVDVMGAAGQPYLAVREAVPCRRCWGTYVINPSDTARNVFVEVPHPLHDWYTAELGVEAFERTDAALLLLAGTHRYANGTPADDCDGVESDMARNRHSLFMAVHRLAGDGTFALQYHGFADRDGYPDAVLSDGSDTPPPHLELLWAELASRRISAGVFDGIRWTDLGATCNPQGEYSRATGGLFVHMELRLAVRSNPDTRTVTVDAVLAVLSRPPNSRVPSDGLAGSRGVWGMGG